MSVSVVKWSVIFHVVAGKKRAGRGVGLLASIQNTHYLSLKWWSCLKMTEFFMSPSHTQVERTTALAIDLSPIYCHQRRLYFLHYFTHISPSSIILSTLPLPPSPTSQKTTLFHLLSPDHGNLCTDGGVLVPMPRQLYWWLQQQR